MSDPEIRFNPDGRVVTVPSGTFLTAAAVRAGVSIVHDCDGQGVCSTCRVRVVEGMENLSDRDDREDRQLGDFVLRGWRLCCLLRVYGNATIEVPDVGFPYPPEMQRGFRP